MTKNKKLHITFYNFEGKDIKPVKFANEIIKEIKKDNNENLLGYGKLSYFKKQLLHQLGDKNIEVSEIDEKKNQQIEKSIIDFLSKFQKELKLKYKPIRFYVYPWFPETKTSKGFGGVNGIATYFTVMHLFIDYKNFSSRSLEETLAHELNHLYFYQAHDSSILNIKESIIAEGLAEHFREYLVGGKVALWSKALGEKKAIKILPRLTTYLNSHDRNVYENIFYGKGSFQKWTGYSVGYVLVKRMLKKIKILNWKRIMNIPVDDFFK